MFEEPHLWCDQQCDPCGLRPSCSAAAAPVVEAAQPIALDHNELRSAASAHATSTLTALQPAVDEGRLDPQVASRVVADAFAVAARVGRIVGRSGEQAIAHLLVLEHLLHRVDGAILSFEALVPAHGLSLQRSRRWELGRRLAPQMRAIGPRHRGALRQLRRARRAPSPFFRSASQAAPQMSMLRLR